MSFLQILTSHMNTSVCNIDLCIKGLVRWLSAGQGHIKVGLSLFVLIFSQRSQKYIFYLSAIFTIASNWKKNLF